MKIGFTLRELTLSGPDKRDAVVTFEPGLNVIAGPSDTGKTFVFQCLDYIMGRSTPPKAIPEAEGYDTIRLSLRDSTGGDHILARSLRGGSVRLSSPDVEDRVLKAKHTADDPNTLSAFLLKLSGLVGKRVRTNAAGTTRPLSFRDLAQLVLVDEESIMTARSPALSGQYTATTVESRIFRLLLTGEDDSSVIAEDDPKVARARRSGQAELLQTLIARARVAHQDDEIPETIDAAAHRVATLRATADEASAVLEEHQAAATEVEARRRAAWTELHTVQSRADVLQELQNRFELLEQQYESDLRRLEAIAEAGLRLDQMTEVRCPVCGALAEHHQHAHSEEQVSPSDISASCQAEASKITTLMQDLHSTQRANAAELDELALKREAWAAELSGIDTELGDALRPKVAAAAQAFRKAEAQRQRAERALELLEHERELQELLEVASSQAPARRDTHTSSGVSTAEADTFARAVESLLRAWHFPDLDRVAFSEAAQDLVISGRARGSHGKGVRAITHAAFVLALLRHALDADLPSPGVVVIDSPLVVYREPDPEEGTFPIALKDYFYKSIAERFEDAQVLILENDAPQAALDTEANIITFTKTDSGRYGFIPKP